MQIVSEKLRVCAGVDVGHGHLDVAWWAFGAGGAVWPLGGVSLPFDPRQPIPWLQLLSELSKPVSVAGVMRVPVSAAAIDSGGHFTQDVYRFVRQHQNAEGPGLIAVKGFAQRLVSEKTMAPRLVDINENGAKHPQSFTVYFLDLVAMQAQLSPWFAAQCPGVQLPDTAVYALAAHHWLSADAGA